MGLFGAIGRETRGAFRSLGYDLRRSRRFRRAGAIAVVAVAGGMIATGALLREPVPGLPNLGEDGADITEGWFGLGSDTTGQDAESSEGSSQSPSAAGEAADPEAAAASATPDARGKNLSDAPGLMPVGEHTSDPVEEGSEQSPTPTQEPSEEPTEEPTTDATETPTGEPTTDAPTMEEPTPSTSVTTSSGPTSSPTTEASAERATRGSTAPIPRKGHIGA
jgi:hypothetical protein